MTNESHSQWSLRKLGPRDLVFGITGGFFVVNEFVLEPSPRAWGVFLIVFLWGLVPAFQLDGGAITPRDVVLHLLGMKPPDDPKGPAAPLKDPEPEPNGGD